MVGRNGAGKTSTLRCLAGIVPLDSGRAECGGRTVSLLELGAGFGPDFSGRENIYLNGALHGLSAAVAGILLSTAYALGKPVVKSWGAAAIVLAAMIAEEYIGINPVWIILLAAWAVGLCVWLFYLIVLAMLVFRLT